MGGKRTNQAKHQPFINGLAEATIAHLERAFQSIPVDDGRGGYLTARVPGPAWEVRYPERGPAPEKYSLLRVTHWVKKADHSGAKRSDWYETPVRATRAHYAYNWLIYQYDKGGWAHTTDPDRRTAKLLTSNDAPVYQLGWLLYQIGENVNRVIEEHLVGRQKTARGYVGTAVDQKVRTALNWPKQEMYMDAPPPSSWPRGELS